MRHGMTQVGSRPRLLLQVVVLILLILPFFLSCTPIRVNTETLAPAKSREMTGIRRIAALDFNGQGGLELSRDVESTLVGIRMKGERHFTVVDRESLANVLHEMGLAERKIVASKTAAKIGQLIGAEAIVLGTVQDAVVNDDFYMAEREVCSDKKCRYRTTRLVFCTKREVHYAFTPKVVRVSSGQIVTSEPLRERLVRHSCTGDRALESRTTLVTQARKKAIEAFVQLIAPHIIKTRLPILLGDSTKPKAGITGTLGRTEQRYVKFHRGGESPSTPLHLTRLEHIQCQFWRHLQPNGILHFLVREIVFTVQVDVAPALYGTVLDSSQKFLLALWVLLLGNQL